MELYEITSVGDARPLRVVHDDRTRARDPTAPMMKWSSHSPMFRNKSQCESFRARAARSLVEDNANADQFVRDDSMVLVIPLWASRCVNIGAPTADSSD